MSAPQLIANRYEVADRIGSGAMGDLYRATDTQTGDTVAVKALKPDLVAANPDMLARFQREGEALRDLNHPNIVALRDVISEGDAHYIVMEYISGGDLSSLISDNPGGLPFERVLNIALDLADALTRAHHLGIIHRDLKPANVLIAEDGTPRLSDFGIALRIEGERLTDSKAIIGTMDYIAPEAINGQPIDTRADVWSFGVMLFEMLAGHRPFRGDSLVSLLASILSESVPDLEAIRPDCPLALVDVVYRMLVKDPQGRIPSVRHVGAALEDIQHGRSAARPDSLFDTPIPEERPRNHLPVPAAPFVGRKGELAEIAAQMAECRLLTLLGPGGMGKSRLSIEAAKQLADHYERGAHFVGLAPIAEPDQIVPTIAEAVGFQFYAGGEPQQQLLDFLREKEMLLLLDNFEHVLAGAGLVSAILENAPKVRVLATSRERLKLSAECVFDVQGLQTPGSERDVVFENFEAVEMFVTYARRVQPDYELREEDKSAIVRICQLVGGMPLGIELAAGWARSLSPQEVADELAVDLDMLSRDTADVPERQRSMRAAFDYSWRRLTEGEQDAFMKFSVFRGGATHEAARAVTGASLRVLSSLVDKSMLRRDTATGRFEVHELMRQFGEEQLRHTADNGLAVYADHSRFYANFLRQHSLDIKGRGANHLIIDDRDNMNVGLQHAITHQRIDDLHWYLTMASITYGVNTAGGFGSVLDQALAMLRTTDLSLDQHRALLGLTIVRKGHLLHWMEGQHELSAPLVAEGMALMSEHDNPLMYADACDLAAACVYDQPEKSSHLTEISLAIYEELGEPWEIGYALNVLGFLLCKLDKFETDRGWDLLVRAEALAREYDMAMTLSHAWTEMGLITGSRLEFERASTYLHQSLTLARQFAEPSWVIMILGILTNCAIASQDWDALQTYDEERAAIAQETGMRPDYMDALSNLALVHEKQGRYDQASEYYQDALDIARHMNDEMHAWVLVNMGYLALARQDRKQAFELFRSAIPLANDWDKLRMLVAVAEMRFADGHLTEAAELACFAMNRSKQEDRPVNRHFWITPTYEKLCDKLTEDEIEQVLDRSKSMDLNDLIHLHFAENLDP